ncbi:hypothetical protein [Gluconobacter frateurii]|uniref:Uncharacterized protein n=1 Tax=Gluconobacter frateurii NRIC 0228 TaxID=1307946 RepID=A0ABQ0Q921_9PROT|nr:hypothetical protein [Gluconobacter frateurii]GBR09539.1 hypothetical protein AA0228_0711 [Gluconobacter frateurii NRIC 0228]GLP91926.1 hypothetical protein GCM10007868_30010 [Gluconobacter frateurii]
MSVDVNNSAGVAAVTVSPGGTPDATAQVTAIGFNATTGELVFSYSDGTQVPVTGLAEGIAQSLGGASLAVLDKNGALLLGGKPRLGVSEAGNLTVPTALPDTATGYDPVTGSGELYQNGTGPIQEA